MEAGKIAGNMEKIWENPEKPQKHADFRQKNKEKD